MLTLTEDFGALAVLVPFIAFTVVCMFKLTRNRKLRIRSHRIAERLQNRD
jgi:hypothetical protein